MIKMEIAVLAESTRLDVEVYQILITKFLNEKYRVVFRVLENVNFQGKHDLLNQLSLAIDLLCGKFPRLTLIVIVVDGDNLSGNKQRREVINIIEKKVKTFPWERIVTGVAVKNLEAWLLSDEKAIEETTAFKIKKPFKFAEKIEDPKNKMRQIYGTYCKEVKSKGGKIKRYSDFIKSLASNSNIQLISRKSSSFRAFQSELRSASKRACASK